MTNQLVSSKIAQFQIKDPTAVVSGAPMMGFIQCVTAESVLPVLERHNLDQIEPDGWYPFTEYLKVMEELVSPEDMISVGMSMMENVPWPPEVYKMPFADVLRSINAIYKVQHRGDVGEGYVMDFIDDHHVAITICNPYPDDLCYGCYWQIAKMFLPKGTPFKVYYDESQPLRKDGGEQTTIHMTW